MINKIIKYDSGISNLSEEALEAIDSNHIETAVGRISQLTELGYDSLDNSQAYITKIILKLIHIGDVVKEKRSERLAKIVCIAFGTLGVRAVNKESMIRRYLIGNFTKNNMESGDVIELIIYGLKENAIGAIDCDFDDDIIKSYSNYLFKMGYDVTCFNKIVKPNFRHLLNPRGFIVTGTACIVYSLLNIADMSFSKKEYIFCWDSVPEQDSNELRTFLKEDKDTLDYKFVFMDKSTDGKEINLSGGYINPYRNSQEPDFSFRLNEEKHIAILTKNLNPYTIYEKVFSAEKMNGKISIYKFKFEKTLEFSLFYLWVFGANFMKYSPVDGRIMAQCQLRCKIPHFLRFKFPHLIIKFPLDCQIF